MKTLLIFILGFGIPAVCGSLPGRAEEVKDTLSQAPEVAEFGTITTMAEDFLTTRARSFIGEYDSHKAVHITEYGPISTVRLGQPFGCRIDFLTFMKTVHFTAKLHGPASLKKFHPSADRVSFSEHDTVISAEEDVDARKTRISYFYSIDKGDPLGSYEMTCYLEGVPVESFKLEANGSL